MKSIAKCAPVLALLLATAAHAQTSSQPANPSNPPAATDSNTRPANPPSSATSSSSQSSMPSQAGRASASNMDWRASKLIGSAVYNQANERIGDINELLLDESGKVAHVVLGVGGFLGMGERQVAVPFSDLKITQDGSSMKIMTSFNKQSLSSMPEWRDDRSSTGSSTSSRPANSSNAPANSTAPQNR